MWLGHRFSYIALINDIYSFDANMHAMLPGSACVRGGDILSLLLLAPDPWSINMEHQLDETMGWRAQVWMYEWRYEWTCMFPRHFGDDGLHSYTVLGWLSFSQDSGSSRTQWWAAGPGLCMSVLSLPIWTWTCMFPYYSGCWNDDYTSIMMKFQVWNGRDVPQKTVLSLAEVLLP